MTHLRDKTCTRYLLVRHRILSHMPCNCFWSHWSRLCSTQKHQQGSKDTNRRMWHLRGILRSERKTINWTHTNMAGVSVCLTIAAADSTAIGILPFWTVAAIGCIRSGITTSWTIETRRIAHGSVRSPVTAGPSALRWSFAIHTIGARVGSCKGVFSRRADSAGRTITSGVSALNNMIHWLDEKNDVIITYLRHRNLWTPTTLS